MPADAFPIRAFQWDLARQVERLDWLLAQLPRYADWGYQELYLHLEDAVEFPSLPAVAREDAYTYHQMERLVARATKVGIKIVPIVNLLGHTQYLIKVPALRDLNELRQADGSPQATGQICPLHPRTLEVAEKLLRDMAPFCTAGKVHVGLDESFHLGQHPLSRREVLRIGLAAHFAGHVNRLRDLTRKMDLRMGMWADMLYFLPDAIPLLPTDLIAYDWYYYPFKRHPRVELFNYAEFDLATPLMRRGIEYWGCPMNGAFRHEPLPHFGDRLANAKSWWRRCRQVGATGFLMTSWEPNRLAMKTTTLVDAAVAEFWQGKRLGNRTALLARGARKVFDARQHTAMAAGLLAADRHPFTGYTRWEINKCWTLVSGPKSFAHYQRELQHLDRLCRCATHWPTALKASLQFRRYLAIRDVRVRDWHQTVLALRRDWKRGRPLQYSVRDLQRQTTQFLRECTTGRAAARAMWQGTRRHHPAAPNLKLLDDDRAQARAWAAWLQRCLAQPAQIVTASPVAGVWTLSFEVWNFAPAVQRICVDEYVGAGAWHTVKNCHTIEFLSQGATQRSSRKHQHNAPLNGDTDAPPRIRLRVGGVGRVRLTRVQLTNGITTLRARDFNQWIELGSSPTMGWPKLKQESLYQPQLRPI